VGKRGCVTWIVEVLEVWGDKPVRFQIVGCGRIDPHSKVVQAEILDTVDRVLGHLGRALRSRLVLEAGEAEVVFGEVRRVSCCANRRV
jgi:hypothetical protein